MKVILDSSALVAMLHQDDSTHLAAAKLQQTMAGAEWQILLPYEVLAETLNVIGRSLGKHASVAAGLAIIELCDAKELVLVAPETYVIGRANDMQLSAKGSPSFIDCLVMSQADAHKTAYIFGFDATFKKNGYKLPSRA